MLTTISIIKSHVSSGSFLGYPVVSPSSVIHSTPNTAARHATRRPHQPTANSSSENNQLGHISRMQPGTAVSVNSHVHHQSLLRSSLATHFSSRPVPCASSLSLCDGWGVFGCPHHGCEIQLQPNKLGATLQQYRAASTYKRPALTQSPRNQQSRNTRTATRYNSVNFPFADSARRCSTTDRLAGSWGLSYWPGSLSWLSKSSMLPP